MNFRIDAARKFFLAMKLTVFLLTVFSLHVSAGAYSQTISISFEDASLETVMKEIGRQSGYDFLFDAAYLKNAKPITIKITGADIKETLKQVFKGQPFTYSIDGKAIIVKPKPVPDKAAEKKNQKQTNISGMVTDTTGAPLPGVAVQVKWTNKGTLTNGNGEYVLHDVAEDAILEYSLIGYQKQQVPVNYRAMIHVILKVELSRLDQAVVIGYGKTTQRFNTGSVSKIASEEIGSQPVANPLLALQGRAPGVLVTNANGLPGANVTVQIRGRNSIAAGNNPLYIVDGVPFISTPLNDGDFDLLGAAREISPFNSINPEAIASIEILKDADATAIYGSRGANGVVLITTKKGQAGKIDVGINIYSGIGKVANTVDMLNTRQYLELRREAFENDGVTPSDGNAPDLLLWDENRYTDWQKFLTGGTAPVTNASLSISGGNPNIRFLLSGHYRKEGTVYPGESGYNRAGAHMNVNFNSASKKFGGNISTLYTADDNYMLPGYGLTLLYTLPPNYPLYDDNGNLYWSGSLTNPLAYLKQEADNKTANLVSNAQLHYALTPALNLKASLGYTNIQLNQVLTYPASSQNPARNPTSYAVFSENSSTAYIVEPQADYQSRIGNGDFQALIGFTWQHNIREGYFIRGNGYTNESLLHSIGAATNIADYYNNYIEYKYVSIFSRISYNWLSKYLVNATFRRDGSSRFGKNKQFGNFWAVGAGWIFSTEPFIKNNLSFLSHGKLRGSFGVTGNDQISDYQYLSTYRTAGVYKGLASLQPVRIANPDYSWEVNKKLEAALELGLWDDTHLLTVAWYRNRSSNQLVSYPLAIQSGFDGYQSNLPALVQNEGWELELRSNILNKSGFSWGTSVNINFPENTLLEFPGLASTSFANTYVIGEPLNIIKGYRFTGVDSENGAVQYLDVNDDGIISNPDDFVIIGNTSPEYFGGLGNNLRYNGFELDVFFQFVKQAGYSLTSIYPPGYSLNNHPIQVLNRWKEDGDLTDVSGASATFGKPIHSAFFIKHSQSDQRLSDASFIRLKNVSLSYSLPESWIRKLRAEQCRVYLQGQNLFTITNYRGFDPETQGAAALPPLRVITAGIHLSF